MALKLVQKTVPQRGFKIDVKRVRKRSPKRVLNRVQEP